MESMTDCAFSCPISAKAQHQPALESFEEPGLTLVVVHHVPQVVSSAVVRLADTHRVVREVDIAIIT